MNKPFPAMNLITIGVNHVGFALFLGVADNLY